MTVSGEDLQLFTHADSARTRVDLGGELDMATAQTFREHLRRIETVGTGDVEIDMSGVGFCDSSGLGALINAHQNLLALGRRLRIVNAPHQVTRLLNITGLDTVLLGPLTADAEGDAPGT